MGLLVTSTLPLRGRFLGWLLVGAIMGLVSGLFAPAFRRRGSASLTVWFGLSVALVVVSPYWRLNDWLELPGGAVLFAGFGAIIYGLLCWEYVEPDPNRPVPHGPWPAIVRALVDRIRSRSRPAT
jgi:hypothetical protein